MVSRLIIGAVLFYIGFFDNPIVSSGLPKTVLSIAAFVPLFTGLLRFCPLYRLVGMNTYGDEKSSSS